MLKEVALLTPIFVTFFWSLVFFIQLNKTDKPKFNLGIFMILAFLLYCSHAIFFSKLYDLYSYIECIYIFSMLSVYPMYFIYLSLLATEKLNLKRQLIHFIPALFFGVVALITTFLLTPEERIIYVKEILINKNLKGLNISTLTGIKGLVFFLSRGVFLIQIGFYVFKGIRIANKHNEQIANYYSDTEGKTLNWVRQISIIILVVSIASITFVFIGRSYFTQHEVSLVIPSAIFSILLFTLGFKGNQQVQVNFEFGEEELLIDLNIDKNGQNNKMKRELIQLFDIDKIYKNPDLRITSVSGLLKTNRTYISKLINEEFQMNFNEFVNKYRIEEAKKWMEDTDRDSYTLEYIAEKSGFGSVNSFTRVFKTIVGSPPGKWGRIINRKLP